MARKITEEEVQMVRNLVARFPNGVTIRELAERIPSVSKRTILRRIETLIDRREIMRQGHGRGTIYLSKEKQIYVEMIALSKEGKEIRSYIAKEKIHRNPVGYHREFLAKYIPNESSYLTNQMKEKLLSLGQQLGCQFCS